MYHPLLPGRQIGPYEIQSTITMGTFGTFYMVKHRETQEQAVLKTIKTPPSAGGMVVGYDLFALGQRLLTLQHPAILPTVLIDFAHDPPFLVVAHASGGTLGQRLAVSFPASWPLAVATRIVHSIGSALSYLHAQQIAHAGLQPSCILFDHQGNALLSGFDLARSVPSPRHLWTHTTSYAAPEQEEGVEVTASSDLYALGRIAYQLLTGTTPDLQSPARLSRAMFQGDVPVPVGRAILRAIEDMPDQRWPSVAAFLEAWTIS